MKEENEGHQLRRVVVFDAHSCSQISSSSNICGVTMMLHDSLTVCDVFVTTFTLRASRK